VPATSKVADAGASSVDAISAGLQTEPDSGAFDSTATVVGTGISIAAIAGFGGLLIASRRRPAS
jgi:hypothetical protein